MTRTSLLSVSIIALCACTDAATLPANPQVASVSGWCFHGGTIHTADDAQPQVDAVAVVDDRIVHAGDMTDGWCPEGAADYDLAGATLYPGLTDAHAHLIGIGKREMELDLTDAKSVRELQDLVRDVADRTPAGETIYGDGWIETHWPEDRFPNRDDLDAVTTDHPVILQRADGHAAVANSLALERAGITGDTEAPFGGAINLDETGRPTGMLIDNAQRLTADQIPEMDEAGRSDAFRLGSEVYASRGWTNIHSMSVDRANVGLIDRLSGDGDIKIRVYNSVGLPDAQAERLMPTLLQDMEGQSTRVVTRAVKLYADGALGSRGAALQEPYSDDPANVGLMTLDKDVALPVFEAALRNGIQVNTHAIGDMGNKKILSWYEQAFAAVPSSERAVVEPRWRVEHSQILDMGDIERFAALGVIPSMQPSHAIGDLHFAVDRLGPDRLGGAYAWRALIDSGSIIAGGSDAPVEVGDPRIELHAAMRRTDLQGYSNENWGADQVVTPQEALKMFTLWPAYAAFQEEELGSIEVGKKADFSIFDRDMLDPAIDPMDAEPVMTMVDGEVIWSR
ncbi:MAG: amidohydrolase [Litorimonas sp.]